MSSAPEAATAPQRVALVLKTNEGGAWVLSQIRALRDSGHQVTVILPVGRGRLRRKLDEQGVPCLDSAFDFRFRPSPKCASGLWRLRRQIKSLSPTVVFYHLYASALAARLASLGLGAIRVHMVPGPLYLDSWIIRVAERALCRLDDLVIGGSAHTADRYARIGMPQSRLMSIPYGVDTTFVSPQAALTERWSGKPEQFVVIMVAYVYAPKRAVHSGVGIKGHDSLVRVWSDFAKHHDDVHLLLVGAGFDDAGEDHRRQLMAELRIEEVDSLTWLDSVEDVRTYYAGADVSVSPSLSENHGAALEASAMAVPSIVSDAGALPETVIHGTSGWVVPAADDAALNRALEMAYTAWTLGTLSEMGLNARDHIVTNFDQRSCAQMVVAAIEHATTGGGIRQ